ncbi:hypothetical protein [Ensifer sp. SL37]|uniref:hypothetical protein n=1 Tax=Ensifer sp. SL37 TaxID=2995137 RepID=UPI0022756FB4|nr:hypothetical protein [Ensifer sp. SL37]MCY1745745.1 hypothetical protein [Ensifer sp. SL37]
MVLRIAMAQDVAKNGAAGPGGVQEAGIAREFQRKPELAGVKAHDPVKGPAIAPRLIRQANLRIAQTDCRHGLAQFGNAAFQSLLVTFAIGAIANHFDRVEVAVSFDAHDKPHVGFVKFSHKYDNFVNYETFC